MKTLARFLAWRYLRGTKEQKNISLMLFISFAGILIGSFSLALVLSIMNGFEKVTHEKLQSIHAQAIMRAYGDDLNITPITTILDREFPEIIGYSPTILKQAIIQNDTQEDATNVVLMKGIDPARESSTTAIGKKIISSISPLKTASLEMLVHDNHLIIGKKLAESLDIVVGDQLTILFASHDQIRTRKIRFNQKRAVVSGIFDTGIEDFDSSLVICSFEFIKSMWPESEATQLNLQFAPDASEQETIKKLRTRFNLEVYSWQDLYPALVSALKLEKIVMFFILALITLVASMNIISLQFMNITQKRGDIAILKSLGMKETDITQIFVSIGMIVTTLGALSGLGLAALTGFLLTRYPFISLPDAYYVTHLPVHMELSLFALVFFLVVALGFIATWIPARATRTINIADVLRFDA